MKKLLILILILSGVAGMSARPPKEKTTRPVLTTKHNEPAAFDTVMIASTGLKFQGYDKPLRSNVETVLATNNLPVPVVKIEVVVRYYDMKKQKLNERTAWVEAPLEPGQKKMLKFPSWDVQHSYYYHLGQVPRVDKVTPYSVTITPKRAIVAKLSE